jgi:hypothetical protein
MFKQLKIFFEIALLKKSPQDIPSSLFLRYLVIAIYLAINFLILFMSETWTQVLLEMAVELIFIIIFCKFILHWGKKPTRYWQTFIALLGVDALISFCAVPALATLNTPMPENSSFFLFAIIISIIFILWHWVTVGHIFRHALSEPFIFGLGVALLYLIISYQFKIILFS